MQFFSPFSQLSLYGCLERMIFTDLYSRTKHTGSVPLLWARDNVVQVTTCHALYSDGCFKKEDNSVPI